MTPREEIEIRFCADTAEVVAGIAEAFRSFGEVAMRAVAAAEGFSTAASAGTFLLKGRRCLAEKRNGNACLLWPQDRKGDDDPLHILLRLEGLYGQALADGLAKYPGV